MTNTKPVSGVARKGWTDCPEEIRLKIFGFALAYEEPIYSSLHSRILSSNIIPILCLDRIGLLLNAFYASNTFRFPQSGFPFYGGFYMPKLDAPTYHTRKIHVQIKPSGESWRFLYKFSRGQFGFSNLRELRITIDPGRAPVCISETLAFAELEEWVAIVTTESPLAFRIPKVSICCLDLPASLAPQHLKTQFVQKTLSSFLINLPTSKEAQVEYKRWHWAPPTLMVGWHSVKVLIGSWSEMPQDPFESGSLEWHTTKEMSY
ncbi:hypothetical protein P280DRAFT_523806 [Massarina eburnea CBS 473.64]|uniref:Uncharacterized protein n=1 Tax=Massarina eburnea CBS 473.64 TaxID=1395130 RepID=A0A6A6RL16_9PLEO|nr:hypothetical protein P280DRAFT_523806 [Massarina eburnea CBS 473.64]